MSELDGRCCHSKQVDARERARGERCQVAVVDAGERRDVRLVGAVAQHRRRGRETPGLLRKTRQPERDRSADRFGPHRADPPGVRGLRRDALTVERRHEGAREERVAARRRMAGGHELGVRRHLELLLDDRRHSLPAEGDRPDHEGARVRDDLRQELSLDALLRRAQADDDQQRHPLQAAGQEREPAQCRRVSPVEVVDDERERPALRDVRGEPIEPVQDGERDVCRRRSRQLLVVEKPLGERSRAGQKLLALDRRK